jgi:hypothetical protein
MGNNLQMKTFTCFIVFSFLALISLNSLAQTRERIENDLYKSFKKINYWTEKRNGGVIEASDSLETANNAFDEKLKYYAGKYPFTIDLKFSSLKKENLGISTSSDGLLRIYSWDTQTGGTMHIYNDLLQYKVHNKTYSTNLRDITNESDNGSSYDDIYSLKENGKTYYLVQHSSIYDSHSWSVGIRIFSIENGKLNKNVEIIKTEDGLSGEIGCYYNEKNIDNDDRNENGDFHYDESTKKIYLPIISGNGEKYNDYIIYKFTGQYFEKFKKLK